MPGDVCARAGEVKSATKTASREIRTLPADDLLRLMASSFLGRDTRFKMALNTISWIAQRKAPCWGTASHQHLPLDRACGVQWPELARQCTARDARSAGPNQAVRERG